jgi:hypothetical protein
MNLMTVQSNPCHTWPVFCMLGFLGGCRLIIIKRKTLDSMAEVWDSVLVVLVPTSQWVRQPSR